MRKPIIGLACDVQVDGLHPFHRVGEKYAASVIDAAGGVPVLIPALVDRGENAAMDLASLLELEGEQYHKQENKHNSRVPLF